MLFNACVWFICRIHVQKWWEHLGLNSESHCSSAVGFFPRSLVASQHAPVSDVLPFLSPVVAAAVAAEIRPCEFPRAGIANVAVFVGAIENFTDFVPADKLDGRGNENPKIIIRYYNILPGGRVEPVTLRKAKESTKIPSPCYPCRTRMR